MDLLSIQGYEENKVDSMKLKINKRRVRVGGLKEGFKMAEKRT